MARNATMMPMTRGGSGTGRRLLAVLVALLALALVLRDPVGAAQTVQQLARWGSDVLDALSVFGAALSE
jgi:hypothetical protein